MGKLIDQQVAIDVMLKESNTNGAYGYMDTKSIVDLLNDLLSAQPDIIRCKDCKWSDWYNSVDGNIYCYCMETGEAGRTADDYCSYAEKENR